MKLRASKRSQVCLQIVFAQQADRPATARSTQTQSTATLPARNTAIAPGPAPRQGRVTPVRSPWPAAPSTASSPTHAPTGRPAAGWPDMHWPPPVSRRRCLARAARPPARSATVRSRQSQSPAPTPVVRAAASACVHSGRPGVPRRLRSTPCRASVAHTARRSSPPRSMVQVRPTPAAGTAACLAP